MSTQGRIAPLMQALFRTWILTPLGCVALLCFVLGIDSLISLGTVAFPASVICLLFLFLALLAFEALLPERLMGMILDTLDVPMGFALRTMSLYFTPNFVMLPTSKPIGGTQIGVLIGVFTIGYVVQLALTAYTCQGVQVVLRRVRPSAGTGCEKANGGHRHNNIQLCVVRTPSGEQNSIPTRMNTALNNRGQDVSDIEAATAHHAGEVEESSSTDGKPDAVPGGTAKWSSLFSKNINLIPYIVLLLLGVPIAYAAGYTMPLFLGLNVLIFHAISALPPKVRRIANPVLVTGLAMILCVYLFTLTKHQTLAEGLHLYRPGILYRSYLRGEPNLPPPSAGDLLAALLDVSIVSLALPMFQYRGELRKHFLAIAMPVVALAIPSLFAYPALCHALGVEPAIGLAVAPRSVTLALALLSTDNLGGSVEVVSVLAIVSGICGPIFGMSILRVLHISKDDFVTVGVTMGANSSAIATAMLLEKDRRAAALSSLSMSLYGLLFVILTVIPPISHSVRGLVGLA